MCFFVLYCSPSKARKTGAHSFSSGQVSIEYLIILAAFFAVLGVIFPVIASSSKGFLEFGDVLLAKRIALEVEEKSSLLKFLADGSEVTLEYSPVGEVSVFSRGSQVVAESFGREFFAQTPSPQFIVKESFNKKFNIILVKTKNNIQVFAK